MRDKRLINQLIYRQITIFLIFARFSYELYFSHEKRKNQEDEMLKREGLFVKKYLSRFSQGIPEVPGFPDIPGIRSIRSYRSIRSCRASPFYFTLISFTPCEAMKKLRSAVDWSCWRHRSRTCVRRSRPSWLR